MSKLTIFRGVPGSGKTTEAVRRVANGDVRVSRDDIRFSLFGKYHGVNEEIVTDVENSMVESALRNGQNVVLDATNLHNKFLKTKLSLASRWGAEVEFVDFPISLEEAVSRDAGRAKQVGRKVIERFFKASKIDPVHGILKAPPVPLPVFEPYVPDTTKRNAYIVDTDGTVANHEPHRNPYDTSKYHLDTVHESVAGLVRAIQESNTFVIALSGRDAKYASITRQWWQENRLHFDEFHFRPEGDVRMDAIVKYDLFREAIADRYNVLGAIDDRPQVIRMWETIGVPVLKVGPGLEF